MEWNENGRENNNKWISTKWERKVEERQRKVEIKKSRENGD